jgi:tetratricopeptide (TPR) repeat protein
MIAEGLHAPTGSPARIAAVLSEEALIVLLAFGACGLLVLGILELLWPTRPRHPMRRAAPPLRPRPHRQSALARHTRERGRGAYVRRPAEGLTSPPPAAAPAPLPTPEPLLAPRPLEAVAPAPIAAAPPPAVGDDESVVEACFALYQAQRHDDVVALATRALGADAGGRRPADAQETAALWSVLALARQALGADADARAALEAAIAAAPVGDRVIYERQLASLAESVAQGLLAEADRHTGPDSEECLTTMRSAVSWLERGAAAAPNDAGLADLAVAAQARLWPAWERTVMALVQRQEYRAARRLLRDALADPRFPPGRDATFRELFSGTFSGEIGQLTAQAIRSMHEARESDALASLQRAEALLGTLNDDVLPPTRRQEVDRRLWWGYNKLGVRRVEAGEHEEALEPLFHALDYEVGPERRQETVALLVRALEGVVDARSLTIRELAEAGDSEAAVVQCDKLWSRLRSATEMGLRQEDLAATFARVQRLFETLGRPRY